MNSVLKDNNIKSTIPRVKILDVFQNNSEVTIDDIKNNCSDIDQSTIYRTLELFEDKNIIIRLVSEKRIVYSLRSNHDHYLNCVKCHKKIKLDTCPFEQSEYDGFKILSHTVMIEGICPKCQKKS